MFSEKLLHFIWQTRRFETLDLKDNEGNPISIIQVGTLNSNQGPDFLNAKIKIGEIEFTGDVELHLDSGEWYRHGHHQDEQYNGVILHVTYKANGSKIIRKDMSECPEIVLENRINLSLIEDYASIQAAKSLIPCEALFPKVAKDFQTKQWIESLGIARIGEKAEKMGLRLQALKKDWNQVAWENLLVYMCGPVNAIAAQRLGEILPYSIVKKYASKPFQMEALLFGASNLLDIEEQDEYAESLEKEWTYLKAKHNLSVSEIPFSYLRMRPPNFPDLRLAQVVSIVTTYPELTNLLEMEEIADYIENPFLPSEYWKMHYRLGNHSKAKTKPIGESQQEILFINWLAPLGFLYRTEHGMEDASDWALFLLSILHVERNKVTKIFRTLGFPAQHALHSQGMIACKKLYCDEKLCLSCEIGNRLLR